MKSFFRSGGQTNKSQASLGHSENSRSSTPESQAYGGSSGYPAHHPHPQPEQRSGFQQRPPQQQQQVQPLSQQPPIEAFYQQQQDPQIHSHPAHILSRESSEAPQGYDTGRRPSQPTILVPPHPPHSTSSGVQIQQQRPAPIPGQTQFGQSKQVHVHSEKEHKRSKRSIFGLTSSRDKDKENSPTEKRGLGRSGSINLLSKKSPVQPSQDQGYSPQSPQYQQNVRHSTYFGRVENPSQEDIPEDPSHYQQYRQQHQQKLQRQPQPPQPGQFESPQGQSTHRSPEYAEDTLHFSPQRDQYQAYQQQEESRSSSENYLPYRAGEQGRPSQIIIDQHAALRPPSQSSLGPPSPLIQAPQPDDSRPSTAATSRYSAQSVGQPGQVQQVQQMARDQAQNGGGRQQMRDPREEEHRQYQQDPRARMSQQVSDQGRNTPPPRSRDDPRELDYSQLLQKHEELQAKYSKVKRYYFEREAQVTQLQNTVANQRLSMSKTSLDDAQYAARFERLSGAINNLSFNIRKDWKDIPPWLRPVCNRDAHSTGTKEMTAIGRACITRWLAETVFDRVFHPSLPRDTSMLLKHVERTLRRQGQSGILLTDEQRDDLTTKITTWRLTTIEGLADQLNSRFAPQIQEDLTKVLTEELTNSLKANLNDPPPPGLQEGVSTIVQQAVSISANIPLESRDICIEYYMPGELINDTYMKVETGMTQLTNPGLDERLATALKQQQMLQESPDDQDDGERDVEAEIREAAGKAAQGPSGNGPARTESLASLQSGGSQGGPKALQKSQQQAEKKGSSFLGGFVGKKPAPQQQSQSRQGSTDVRPQGGQGQGQSQGDAVKELTTEEQVEHMRMMGIPPLVPGENKVRFAAFLAVEVRAKMLGAVSDKEGQSAGAGVAKVNILVKAPVYEL